MNFKPMLSADASTTDLTKLNYPLIASPKLDGVRCLLVDGVAYSRNAKPIRNKFVQKWARDYHGLDGELIVGAANDPLCLNNTQSGVMAFDGEPDFVFHAFDLWNDPGRFVDRRLHLEGMFKQFANVGLLNRMVNVDHIPVNSSAELLHHEERWLQHGYEGIMLRHPDGYYKRGRSTMREGGLMKLKRFQDGEAVVTGLEEGRVNQNSAVRDELGRTKRSKDASGLVPSGMVGTIIAMDPQWGELRIAPGTMSHHDRQRFWVGQDHGPVLVGKTIHWRSFGYGVKDKPRFPRYYGIREDK